MPRDLIQNAPATVRTKDWVLTVETASNLHLREQVTVFLMRTFGGLTAAALAIFLLQGFHLFGFALSEKVLLWIGGSTIGEVGGMLLIAVRVLFKRQR